jgi:hypothetical protein
MNEAKAAKAEREAKAQPREVTVDPDKARLAELGISEKMEGALTQMLVKSIRDAGSITEADLAGKVKAKLGAAVKQPMLDAVPPVLRLASATHPIVACLVDGDPGWRVKDAR